MYPLEFGSTAYSVYDKSKIDNVWWRRSRPTLFSFWVHQAWAPWKSFLQFWDFSLKHFLVCCYQLFIHWDCQGSKSLRSADTLMKWKLTELLQCWNFWFAIIGVCWFAARFPEKPKWGRVLVLELRSQFLVMEVNKVHASVLQYFLILS